MAAEKKLAPVFIPPLALMLGRAEELKNTPLTREEIERLRDNAVCMMMDADDAREMERKRGYRDVEPENCFADWHRLRTQVTGKGFLPKIVLCLVGGSDFAAACQSVLEDSGAEHEFQHRELGMRAAFEASADRVRPSLKEADYKSIEAHATVLYVLSKNFTSAEGPDQCREFLKLGRRLLESGATAMKCESAGIAHSKARWIELANASESCEALFDAFVRFPLRSSDAFYTCGMHLLGIPDLIVADETMADVGAVVTLFRVFALYLLEECREGGFASGHSFSLNADSPRYRLLWEPCAGYDEDDFFFNPFGRWRFTTLN